VIDDADDDTELRYEVRVHGKPVERAYDRPTAEARGRLQKRRHPNKHVSVHDRVNGDDAPVE
jgi:hypothetical protein